MNNFVKITIRFQGYFVEYTNENVVQKGTLPVETIVEKFHLKVHFLSMHHTRMRSRNETT